MFTFTNHEVKELQKHPEAYLLLIDYHENDAAAAEACECVKVVESHDARVKELIEELRRIRREKHLCYNCGDELTIECHCGNWVCHDCARNSMADTPICPECKELPCGKCFKINYCKYAFDPINKGGICTLGMRHRKVKSRLDW